MPNILTKKEFWFCFLSAIFLALCCTHYFAPRGFWLDERLILANILANDGAGHFDVLKNSQAFPRVYLIGIDAFAQLFSLSTPAVTRFFPLLAMGAGFTIFAASFYREESSWRVFALTLLAMTAAYKMSYYASELKPYSMDVFVAAFFTRAFLFQKEIGANPPGGKAVVMALTLPLLLFVSYAGLLFFWILLWNYILQEARYRNAIVLIFICLVSSIFSFGLFYFLDLRHSMGDAGLHAYWESYFISTESLPAFLDTFGDGLKKLVTYWYGTSKWYIRGAVLFVPFFVYSLFWGGIRKLREDGLRIVSLESLALVLFLQLVVLGILHKYPFTGERITLFFAPFAMYLTVKGMDAIVKPKWLKHTLLTYFTIYCSICLINTFYHYFVFYSL